MSAEFLQKFSDVTNAAKAMAIDTRERDAVVASAQALIDEANALAARLALIRTQNIEKIAQVHNTDWGAVTASLPSDHVYDKAARLMTSRSRKAVAVLRDATERAYACINSALGDSSPGPKDIDPVSLAGAAASVRDFISGRLTDALIDPASQTPSGTFRRAESHLREWLRRARLIVASAEESVVAFDRAMKFAEDVLGDAQPRDVVVGPPKIMLPPLPDAPPTLEAHSRVDFDPRGFDANPMPVDEIVVEKVGAGDGLRTRRVPTRKGR
jgi:hypothetical protein